MDTKAQKICVSPYIREANLAMLGNYVAIRGSGPVRAGRDMNGRRRANQNLSFQRVDDILGMGLQERERDFSSTGERERELGFRERNRTLKGAIRIRYFMTT